MEQTKLDHFNAYLSEAPSEGTMGTFTFCRPDELRPPNNLHDTELLCDMDVTLPFNWYSRVSTESSESSNLQDFEFSMSFSAASSIEPSNVSPADDLFYKGQLLPLHLPPRLEMVENLSSSSIDNRDEGDFSLITLSCCMQSEGLRTPVTPGDHQHALKQEVGYIGSRAFQHHSLDSGLVKDFHDIDNRKSTESLQDSYFDSQALLPTIEDDSVFPNCYKDPILLCPQRMIEDDRVAEKLYHSSQCSWRGTAVRWKVLFTGLKRSRKYGFEAHARSTKRLTADHTKGSASPLDSRTSCVFPKPLDSGGLARESVKDPYDDHDPQGKSSALYGANKAAAGSKGKKTSSSTRSQKDRLVTKARDCLQRSLKILKSVRFAQKNERASLLEHQVLRMGEIQGTSATDKRSDGGEAKERKSHHQCFNEGFRRSDPSNFSGGSISKFSSPKHSGVLAPSKVCESISSTKFTSPKHSGVLAQSKVCESMSSSTMMELQSAIQGAIAHCKQSQAAGS